MIALPDNICDLSDNQLRTIVVIACECQDEWCTLNMVQLARRAGLNRQAIGTALKALYIRGFLTRMKPTTHNANRASYWWKVRIEA